MAVNITLANLANLENETTAVSAINSNNSIITTALPDALSRSGGSPNAMNSPLDMNSFPIINLPAPGSANSPARLVDVTSSNPISISLSLTGDVTAPASSGVLSTTVGHVNGVAYPASPSTNTVPIVTGSNTVTYQQLAAAQIANNTITASQIANNTITGTQLANNTVGNSQLRQSAAFSVIGNTNSTTSNVADITGTTRQVLAVNTGGTSLLFAQPQGDQLKGTITNDNATAGNVGEFITASVVQGSAVSLTNNTMANITSIPITAGDWDVFGIVYFNLGATTTVTGVQNNISTTSASGSGSPLGAFQNVLMATVTPNTNFFWGVPIGPVRISLSTTTTYFLNTLMLFGTSTSAAYGIIQARRAR